MNKYIVYLLLILEVGGGFMGFAMILAYQPWNKNMNTFLWSAYIGACLLFIFGIFAGLALIKESKYGIVSSAIYQALQIPFISSYVISYNILSGVKLVVGVLGGKPYVMFNIGARCTFNLGIQTGSWGFGINLISLILFVYLIFQLRAKPNVNESSELTEDSSIKNGQ